MGLGLGGYRDVGEGARSEMATSCFVKDLKIWRFGLGMYLVCFLSSFAVLITTMRLHALVLFVTCEPPPPMLKIATAVD